MARPDQSAGLAKLKSQQTLFCLDYVKNKYYKPCVYGAGVGGGCGGGGWGGWGQPGDSSVLPEYNK